MALQLPALMTLMTRHQDAIYQSRSGLQGLAAALIGLHALHVLGGLVAIAILVWRGRMQLQVDEQHAAIRACALYWHFLEVVWIVFFGTLLITG